MSSVAGPYESRNGTQSSVEAVAAEVGLACMHLPLGGIGELAVRTEQAESVLREIAAGNGSPEIAELLGVIGVAGENARNARAFLQTAVNEIEGYAGGILAGAAAGMPEAGHANGRARAAPPEIVAAADEVAGHLLEYASTRSGQMRRYVEILKGQSDEVLCELLRRNIPFVDHMIVTRHRGVFYRVANRILLERGKAKARLDADDLVASAIGICLHACRRYAGGEAKLATYLSSIARQTMLNTLREESFIVGIPGDLSRKVLHKIYSTDMERMQRGEPQLTDAEISEQFGLPLHSNHPQRRSVFHVRQVALLTHLMESLDMSSPDGGHSPEWPYAVRREDALMVGRDPQQTPEEIYIEQTMRIELESVMDRALTERERIVLRARYGFDGSAQSYEEIGRRMLYGGKTIQQVAKQALGKLASGYPHLISFLRSN